MKKLFILAALIFTLTQAKGAMAADQGTFEVAYSSMMTTGIRCSTSTVIRINPSRPTGFTANIAGYRVTNNDSSDMVWIGGPSVSTATANGDSLTNLGEPLAAGSSAPWPIGKTYLSGGQPLIPLFCKAADAAGAAGAVMTITWFGY